MAKVNHHCIGRVLVRGVVPRFDSIWMERTFGTFILSSSAVEESKPTFSPQCGTEAARE